jgi:hypothetical protein
MSSEHSAQCQQRQETTTSTDMSSFLLAHDAISPPMRQSILPSDSTSSPPHQYLPHSQISSIQSWVSAVPTRNSMALHQKHGQIFANNTLILPVYQPDHLAVLDYITQKRRLVLQHFERYSGTRLSKHRVNHCRLGGHGRHPVHTPLTNTHCTTSLTSISKISKHGNAVELKRK